MRKLGVVLYNMRDLGIIMRNLGLNIKKTSLYLS